MRRALALSTRFSVMPEPGKAMTPIGITSSIASLRLKGAAFWWRAQSGLKTTCWTPRLSAHLAAISSAPRGAPRSEEHTSELQSLMRISYAVFCLKKKNNKQNEIVANTIKDKTYPDCTY